MMMTDTTFIFFLFPISLSACFLKSGVQKLVLLAISLYFYSAGSPEYFTLFLALTVINTCIAYAIPHCRSAALKKALLILGIILNTGLLFYYKYSGFTIEIINGLTGSSIGAKDLLLPMGISFFTFKSISLLIDVYKGKVTLQKNPVYPLLYLSFFGHIVSGPIGRYEDFYEQDDSAFDIRQKAEDLTDDSYLFMRGFCKKVLISNTLSPVVSEVFGMDPSQSSASLLWLGSIIYSLQLYYDFSGYSDMAIGIGRIFGLGCHENFNYPYCTQSISEFWRRWHITLGRWFRDYIYIPLGGSRSGGKWRVYFNLFVVWLLTGIWHGANFTFIFWGLTYFIAISIEKYLGLPDRFKSGISRVVYRIFTLIFIDLEWVMFNSRDIKSGLSYIFHMFAGGSSALSDVRALVLLQEYGIILFAAVVFAAPVIPKIKEILSKHDGALSKAADIMMACILTLLFIFSISFIIAGQNNPFLYGNF